MKYLPRVVTKRMRKLLGAFPALLLYGPRQCGKSTLARHEFSNWVHIDLERPRDYNVLTSDLEGFLKEHAGGLIIDEAQRLPALFPALRYVIDQSQGSGRFILLGSASPSLLRGASESLAGRVGLLELTPLRATELTGKSAGERWFWGGYPPVLLSRESDYGRANWLDGYITTLLERDLPALGSHLPPVRLRTLWTMLTHVHGHLLNVSDLARSLSVSTHTVDHDLDILEALFVIRRLSPYHINIQKRLTKSSKVYIRDSGILHFLAGLRKDEELRAWPGCGRSWEGVVIEELIAIAKDQLIAPECYFWRTHAGSEVDLLIKVGDRILPIEIKLGSAVDPFQLRGLRQCMEDLSLDRGWVVTNGEQRLSIGRGIDIIPWREIAAGAVNLSSAL